MDYVLSKIVEHDLMVRQPQEDGNTREAVAQWQFGLEPRINSATEIEIFISAAMSPGIVIENEVVSAKAGKMVEITVSHFFQLAEPTPLYPFSPGIQVTEDQKMELATLVGVSLGTLRGLVYARTVAIIGDSLIMPVLNPLAMLEHFWDTAE